MIWTFGLLLAVISLIALVYGFWRGAMGTALIGAILLWSLGGLVLSEGIDAPPVIKTTDVTTDIIVSTSVYTTYTPANNFLVNLLGIIGFYGGVASLISCFYFSVRGEKRAEEALPF